MLIILLITVKCQNYVLYNTHDIFTKCFSKRLNSFVNNCLYAKISDNYRRFTREREKKWYILYIHFHRVTKHVSRNFRRTCAAWDSTIKLNDVDRKLIARKILCQLKSTFSETFREIETYFWFIRGPFPAESMLNRFREDRPRAAGHQREDSATFETE